MTAPDLPTDGEPAAPYIKYEKERGLQTGGLFLLVHIKDDSIAVILEVSNICVVPPNACSAMVARNR